MTERSFVERNIVVGERLALRPDHRRLAVGEGHVRVEELRDQAFEEFGATRVVRFRDPDELAGCLVDPLEPLPEGAAAVRRVEDEMKGHGRFGREPSRDLDALVARRIVQEEDLMRRMGLLEDRPQPFLQVSRVVEIRDDH